MGSVSKQAVERPNYDIIEFIMSFFFLNRTSEIGSLVMITIFFFVTPLCIQTSESPSSRVVAFFEQCDDHSPQVLTTRSSSHHGLKSKNSSLIVLRLIDQAFKLIITFSDNWKLQLRIGTFE